MENHKPTQNERVLNYIREHGSITQIEALQHCGVMRLASRIADLKRRGYVISGKMITVKNRYDEECRVKQYRLIDNVIGVIRKDFSNGH